MRFDRTQFGRCSSEFERRDTPSSQQGHPARRVGDSAIRLDRSGSVRRTGNRAPAMPPRGRSYSLSSTYRPLKPPQTQTHPRMDEPSHHARKQPQPGLIASHVLAGLPRSTESSLGVGIGRHGITNTTKLDQMGIRSANLGSRNNEGPISVPPARSLLTTRLRIRHNRAAPGM